MTSNATVTIYLMEARDHFKIMLCSEFPEPSMSGKPLDTPDSDTTTLNEINEPPLYKVLLHNDDYTTMDFVVMVLEKVFHKTPSEATVIMLNVHRNGIGVCGIYPAEIAETKIDTVHAMASEAGFPLKASMEQA